MTALAPIWQAGTLYQPGDIVRPASAPAASSAVIPNAGFESGDVNWTKTNVTIVSEAGSYAGAWHAKFVYAGGASGLVRMTTAVAVKPGQSITASCYIRATGPDQVGGDVNIVWLTAAMAVISTSQGNEVNTSNGQAWKKSSVTAAAPANAAFCYLQGDAFALNAGGVVLFDQFSWNYVPPVDATLLYKAVQPAAGFSGSAEPVWPTTLGLTVVDNEVTWEAVNTSRVVWEASPILKSGTVEPTWPTEPGAFVADGTISWECVSRHVEQAPRSKVVVIAAKKVFAADRDIVPFSATANPLDWTSESDAGYLPTGLQSGNANEMKVLNRYRNNVVAMNANGFQMWQVDPDPALMALLDEKPGVGSSWQQAAQPVSNELLYLSQRGVRSIGIAAASENLSAGDVGEPVDSLVVEALDACIAEGGLPISTYYPGQGQYWLAFTDFPDVTPPPLEPLTITGSFPDPGWQGDAESYTYTVAGGVAPYTIDISAGALPGGITLSGATASGTRTTTGPFNWTVRVTDSAGRTATVADTTTTKSAEIYVWRHVTAGISTQHAYASHVSGDVMAVGHDNNVVSYSTNRGVTWATATGVHTGDMHVNGLVKYQGDWYAFGQEVGNSRAAKATGDSFAFANLSIPFTPPDLGAEQVAGVVGDYLYCSGKASTTYVLWRFDGSAWASYNTGIAAPVNSYLTAGIEINGYYLFGTSDGKVLRTQDFVTWGTALTTGATSNVFLAKLGGRVMAANGSSVVYLSDDNGATWPTNYSLFSLPSANGLHFIGCTNGSVVRTSLTGNSGDWTTRLSGPTFASKAIHTGKDLSVVCSISTGVLIGDVA